MAPAHDRTIALFDVDGTLTVPRKASVAGGLMVVHTPDFAAACGLGARALTLSPVFFFLSLTHTVPSYTDSHISV
jgi:hypothetical protein